MQILVREYTSQPDALEFVLLKAMNLSRTMPARPANPLGQYAIGTITVQWRASARSTCWCFRNQLLVARPYLIEGQALLRDLERTKAVEAEMLFLRIGNQKLALISPTIDCGRTPWEE